MPDFVVAVLWRLPRSRQGKRRSGHAGAAEAVQKLDEQAKGVQRTIDPGVAAPAEAVGEPPVEVGFAEPDALKQIAVLKVRAAEGTLGGVAAAGSNNGPAMAAAAVLDAVPPGGGAAVVRENRAGVASPLATTGAAAQTGAAHVMTGTPVSAPAASAATAEACEDDDGEPLVGAQRLWRQYAFHGQGRCRLWRVGLVALAYYAARFCLMMMFGFPTVPARGLPARQFDTFVTLGVSVPLLIFLSFYVIDATLLNRRFIQYLASARTRWPKAAFAQCRARGMQKEDLPEYLDVKMIAHRTRVVGKLVYYPFVILFLMIVSRSSYFDDWDWPVALIILLGVNAVIAVVSAYMLRSAAERARSSALEHLRERLLRHTLNHREDEADAVREIIREVEAERGGAFSLLSQYPIVAAILLPSGGVGVWFLLDYLAKTLR